MTVSTAGERAAATRRPAKRRGTRAGRPGGQGTRSRLQVDERRAQLLDLGAQLFSAHSYDGLSVDDIAQAAGISKGLLYHYFPSKRDFYVETIRAAADELVRETRSANEADPSLPPLERAQAGLDAYLTYAERHGNAFAALLRGGIGSDAEVFEIIESVRRSYVERFMKQLPVLKPTPRVRTAVRGYLGFIEAATLDWLEHQDVPRDKLAAMLMATLESTVAHLLAVEQR